MVLPSFDTNEIVVPSLAKEGKDGMPSAVPKELNKAALEVEERITKLSAARVYDGKAPLVDDEVDSRQPDRLNVLPLTFFSSINSAFGSPTCGLGSAIISSITTSYWAGVCALQKHSARHKPISSSNGLRLIPSNIKTIVKRWNVFGRIIFSLYFRPAMQKIKHIKGTKKQFSTAEGV